MKIYFAGALIQKKQYGEYYQRIVRFLEKLGHEVFEDTTITSVSEARSRSNKEKMNYYNNCLRWISEADIVLLEISFPSTIRIGYEAAIALDKGKPVIAIYYEGKDSVFFSNVEDSKLFMSDYNDLDLEGVIKESIFYASRQTETRFNLLISSEHKEYLDKVSEKTKIPRSVYLRKLIEKDKVESSST